MSCQKSLKSSQQSIPSYTSITVTGAPSENIDEAVDNEVVFEFGGPLGVTAMMIGFPPLMYYLWGCLNFYGGAIVSPLNLDLWKQIIDGAYPTWHATTIYILFALFQLFLAYAMPGPIVQGAPVPSLKGRKLDYLCNGLTSWYVSLIVSFVLHVYGWFRLTEVIDEFGRLMTAAIMTAFTLTIVVYVVTVATNKQHRMSGYLMYDLFMGAPLNPRIRHVDLKMFVEVRITWVLLFYITASAAVKQYELFGYVSAPMWFMVLAHFLYANACMKGEECIPTTWDMTYEKFGFMLIFWNLAGVPFTYCYSTLYLHISSLNNNKPLEHSPGFTVFCYALLLIGYYIWDTANSQKNRFRMIMNGTYIPRHSFPQLPWGTLENPTFIKTQHGNLLLTGGWWGIARKIHYTADLIMAFAWAFITGFETIIPFFYPIFFVIVLIHRVSRDMHRCARKYGKDWEEYCKKVPYIFIPGIY
ncbi:8142_t:CDS:2 [Paraglomus brasilianum]|uniref:Delta(24(24(1)))-sterol reductase n=1 Tax=Paraglomus brasilianum TaxID=144538 RepID=A0A9N9AZM7_9GLOM|nr:8142_t:CDS:2 [Paraglomus brasilianum]